MASSFICRIILEEKLREDTLTFVITIDLQKALDTVSYKKVF